MSNPELDAFNLLPGMVFVRTDDPAVFRVGNVEAENAQTVSVSFSDPAGGPRAAAESLNRTVVLSPDDVDNSDRSSLQILLGRRLVRHKAPPFVEIVEAQATISAPTRTVAVRRLAYDGNSWSRVGPIEEVDPNSVFTAPFLAFVEKWSWLQPVDPFIDVISTPIGGSFAVTGRADLTSRDVRIPLDATLNIKARSASIAATTHPSLGNQINQLPPKYLVRARLESLTTAPQWTARYVSIGGATQSWAFDTGAAPASLSLDSPWIDVQISSARTVFTREVFDGIQFKAATGHILRREPPLPPLPIPTGPPCIRTTLFGRPAIIYKPPNPESPEQPVTAVLYHGRSITEPQRRALTSVLGYLAGGRAGHILTESFDVRHKTRLQFFDRGQATARMSPPVPLATPSPHAHFVVDQLPRLFDQVARIYASGDSRTLDAVFHHYAEGVDSTYPVTRILRMSVAFEALVNLVTADSKENEPITVKATFRKIRQKLTAIIKDASQGDKPLLNATEAKRFGTKIDNLNIGSNTARIERFWAITRVHRTKRDDALIRTLRNDSVHQGFVGDESTTRARWKVHRDADRLVDIFNRCLLAFLGYNGPVISADKKRWMYPKSGRRFRLPVLPPGPNINVTTTITQPLTEDEAAALARLRKIHEAASSSQEE